MSINNDKNYKKRYLKYKKKYANLKNKGGTLIEEINCMNNNYYIDDIIFTISRKEKQLKLNIDIIKSKQLITFRDFMNLEIISNDLNNLETFIDYYYKRTILIEISKSPNDKSQHNILYNTLSTLENIEKKTFVEDFIKEHILKKIYSLKNLLDDSIILDKFKTLLESMKLSTSNNFDDQQNIDILTKYVILIERNIKNIEWKEIENKSNDDIRKLWSEIKIKDKSPQIKIEHYRNILLNLFDTATSLGYDNILSYHQQKQKVDLLSYKTIEKILIDNLQIFNRNHLKLENELKSGREINTINEFQNFHKEFLKNKYGDINQLINKNINIPNLIEGLRWIVYKYYNLLMKKSTLCKPYKDTIMVYEFFSITTSKLVGVVYFDINYDRPFSQGYISEFRRKYKYINNTYKTILVLPIIYLYIDFKNINLHEIKLKLFHEFGHAIHTILSQNNYQLLSPNKMAADYVEIVSQFFEFYIFEKEFINRFLVSKYIDVREIPDYDNLDQIDLHINFEEYFNESENKFLQNINYLLICLLEIKLKTLSRLEIEQINIIEYSEAFLEKLKRDYNLPKYVSYNTNVFDFDKIYKYPIYYVYLISKLIVEQIRACFGDSLFDSDKTNIFINDILSKGDISNISEEITKLLLKLK